jgi:hypothetical protein
MVLLGIHGGIVISAFVAATAISTAIVSATLVSTATSSAAPAPASAASSPAPFTTPLINAARLLVVETLLVLWRAVCTTLILRTIATMLRLNVMLALVLRTIIATPRRRLAIALHVAPLLRAVHILSATLLLAALGILGGLLGGKFHCKTLSQGEFSFAARGRRLSVRHLWRTAASASSTTPATATTTPASTSTASTPAPTASAGLLGIGALVRDASRLQLDLLFVIVLWRNGRLIPSGLVGLLAHGFLRSFAVLFGLFFLLVIRMAGIAFAGPFIRIFFSLFGHFFRLIV